MKTNRAGDATPDWATASRVAVSPVNVQPLSTTERVAIGGDLSVLMMRVFTGRGVDVDVLATDRVEYAGNTFEVVGAPQRWPDPMAAGRIHHVEFVIKLWGATT